MSASAGATLGTPLGASRWMSGSESSLAGGDEWRSPMRRAPSLLADSFGDGPAGSPSLPRAGSLPFPVPEDKYGYLFKRSSGAIKRWDRYAPTRVAMPPIDVCPDRQIAEGARTPCTLCGLRPDVCARVQALVPPERERHAPSVQLAAGTRRPHGARRRRTWPDVESAAAVTWVGGGVGWACGRRRTRRRSPWRCT